MDPSTVTKPPKRLKVAIAILLTDASAVLGLLMFIMSLAYLFIAVSITKEGTKLDRECLCSGHATLSAITACQSRGVPPPKGIPTNDTKSDKDLTTVHRYCRNMRQEISAGALGMFFGFFQAVAACVFLLAGVPDALKLIWIIIHAVVALVSAVITLLVFDVILYKILSRNEDGETSVHFRKGFFHDGRPASIARANIVVFVYLTFVFMDVIMTVMGIVLMVTTKPVKRVADAKPVVDEPVIEPWSELEDSESLNKNEP